jgi:hypothetical protein
LERNRSDTQRDEPEVGECRNEKHRVDRRHLLQGAGLGALGALAAVSAAPVAVQASELRRTKTPDVLGAWHATIQIDGTPAPAPFDTLYAFGPGGIFARVDGRNNAPSLGTWKATGKNKLVFAFLVFILSPTGQRAGTVTALCNATVTGDALAGKWSATGVDLAGASLAGFPKTGTYQAQRIVAQGP